MKDSSATATSPDPTADVAVIGGGLVGCAAALALRRRGLSVVLLEQGWCGAQASGVNHGGVRRQGRPTTQLPLAQRAHAIWQRLPELIGGDGEYAMTGHLKLARTEADMAVLEADNARAAPFGLELEMLGRDQLRRRYPALGEKLAGASFCARDGQANPRLVAAGFALAARRQGVRIHEGETVEDAALDGFRFRLRARSGMQVTSTYLLNCAGAWGARVAAQFGDHVPEFSIFPNMLVTEPIAPLQLPNIGVVGGDIYARQVARGNVVLGGGRGTGALQLSANRPDSGASLDAIRTAGDFIPALANALVIRSWTGVEGAFADGQPVIGPSFTTPGLWHAFGFCGTGFQLAPAVGEVLCDLVTGNTTPTPIGPFSIGRFARHDAISEFTGHD
jgi:sarcosine oxidase subunit beta